MSTSESSSDSEVQDMVEVLDKEDFVHRRNQTVRPRINHSAILNDTEFSMRFRLNKSTVNDVLLKIGPHIEKSARNHGIPPLHQLLLTLRFYAMGSMLISVADFIGVSTASACRIVNNVSRAIAQHLLDEHIFMSTTSCHGFYEIASFPNVIGVVDATHIRIQSPGGPNAEEFRNSKGYFSLNVQGVCDANLKFIDIVARWPGSTHNSTMFYNSVLRDRFERGDFGDKWLIGDNAYGLKPYLLTPLVNPHLEGELLYNESLFRTRNTIECCFSVWKQRFPAIGLKFRLSLERIQAVIYATAILHNIAIDQKVELPPPEVIMEDNAIPSNNVCAGHGYGFDENVRMDLVNHYFSRLPELAKDTS